MRWPGGRDPDDPEGLREPFVIVRSRFNRSTPLRSPWAMLAVGLMIEAGAIALVWWAAMMASVGRAGNLGPAQLIGLGAILVLIPAPMLWIGVARVRWLFRYRHAYGDFPNPERG